MPSTRSPTTILIATFVTSLSACSTLDIDDYCRYSSAQSIRAADPEALALVLGVKPARASAPPFVVFRSVAENSTQASVTLSATAAPHVMATSLDESACAGVDWNTYTLSVEREAWDAFWLNDRTADFEVLIAFLDHGEALRVRDFGAAILDTSAPDFLVSCGCYWK